MYNVSYAISSPSSPPPPQCTTVYLLDLHAGAHEQSTMKGHSLGTIPSPLISPVAAAQRSPTSASGSFSFKWSNRPPERLGVETSPVTGFVPLVSMTQDEKGYSPVIDGTSAAPKKAQVPLTSPLGSSAFHIVSPTSSPTKT